uniref:Integrin alpha FG-GAP repeat containing 1 n=1 Tax=Dicentrarchus labrax TaxID=13489 RepID=A0A8C4FCH8_DICLA
IRMWLFKSNLWAFFFLFVGQYNTCALQDVTADLFGGENYGTVAAFGDIYADKQTDIFIIRELVIFVADSKAPYFKPKVHITKDLFPSETIITSVVPGDYDGDSQMDVLLTAQINSNFETVLIFWGHNQTLGTVLTVKDLTLPLAHLQYVCTFMKLHNPSVSFCLLFSQDGKFTRAEIMPGDPPPAKIVGQSSFVDFDGDGYQDHLLPVCLDDGCKNSTIYLAKSGSKEWVSVLSDFQRRETVWSFVPAKPSQPLALHLGDYNLDGFPDALVVLRNTSGSGQQAFLLENVPCNSASCHSVGRMFHIHWDQSDLGAIQNAVMATFFDIYEDGILDMLVLSQKEGKKDLIIHALKNNFEADAYFVKVMVLSGLCSNDCPEDVKPFGVNQPGPYVMYTTVDSNGYLKNASAGQLSQSAHFSLQLPYTVLGLGRSANFLDHLFVGIPRKPGDTDIRKQEWTAIIPNSQLIVIPFPHNKPRSWSAKLYLTPSNSVLLTAIALIGVCVFILVIIGILHWQEKKADDREKRQEAHRFHFDAM